MKTINMGGNQFLKTELILEGGKTIFWLVETIFFQCLRYFLRSSSFQLVEMHFSVQKKKQRFSIQNFSPASENHYLNIEKPI